MIKSKKKKTPNPNRVQHGQTNERTDEGTRFENLRIVVASVGRRKKGKIGSKTGTTTSGIQFWENVEHFEKTTNSATARARRRKAKHTFMKINNEE